MLCKAAGAYARIAAATPAPCPLPPAEVDAYTNEYQDDSDIIARFIREYAHTDELIEGNVVSWNDVSSTFQEWKRQNELGHRGSATDLKKRLEERFGKYPRPGWTAFRFGAV